MAAQATGIMPLFGPRIFRPRIIRPWDISAIFLNLIFPNIKRPIGCAVLIPLLTHHWSYKNVCKMLNRICIPYHRTNMQITAVQRERDVIIFLVLVSLTTEFSALRSWTKFRTLKPNLRAGVMSMTHPKYGLSCNWIDSIFRAPKPPYFRTLKALHWRACAVKVQS